ncbi:MAG TPA: hypothetical protein VJ921_08045 [Vicinamibacteria bacterium]|nr:hypothetical protein [Vicinamibacteria bacterium]
MILALAVVSYLWLCAAWFDHDLGLGFVSEAPPAIPAILFLVSISAGVFRNRKRLAPGAEGRTAIVLGVAGFLTRLPFVLEAYGLFSSDAAAQGVMALHVLEGKHHPIFLYNWSYVGSAKAHLTAALALLVSDPVASFALAAALVYGALTAAVYLLSRTIGSRGESLLAALYVVLAPGFLTAWGMGNEGSYPDVLALGTLMLALGFRFLKDEFDGVAAAFWIGILGGFAFWIHILATYYLLAAAGILLVHRFGKSAVSRLSAFALGFAVGNFPGILWNLSHEFQSFRWWAVDSAPAGAAAASRVDRTLAQLAEVFRTSFAVLAGYWPKNDPPPPETFFRVSLLLLFPLSFLVFAYRYREKLRLLARGRVTPEAAALGFAVLVVLVFAQSSFGWMTEEPRYLLFLFSVLPLFVATALTSLFRLSRLAAFAAVCGLLFVSLRGAILYFASARESDAANREFLRKLDELHIRHVHSDYHLSYKYVFLSRGRMVWTSALGPSQTEWYLPFREEVSSASDVALVPRSFRFARRIERRLDERGIRYRREDLLYPVLFDFSEKVSLSWLVP